MGNKIISGDQSVDVSLDHPKISSASLITNIDRSILRVKVPCDDEEYKKWTTILDKQKVISHENLLLPLKHKFTKQGLCATQGQVEIDFPAYPFLLNSEIHQRKIKSIIFTQAQLWYLIFALLSVDNYLEGIGSEQKQSIFGDIRPQNIFISQNGFVKFVNLLTWPSENKGYSKAFQGTIAYLSPEDMELLQLGKMNNNDNRQKKSTEFVIGLTMLSSILLVDNSDLYDLNKKQFNYKLLNKRLYYLVNNTVGYSQFLKGAIFGLCAISQQKRLLSKQLWQWLRVYEKQISRKQAFVVDQLPTKINQTLKEMKSFSVNQKDQQNKQLSQLNLKTTSSQERKNNFLSFETRQIIKSSEGFYSPRSHTNINGQQQQYKVFIQYKSPSKQMTKHHSQTVYEKSSQKNKQTVTASTLTKDQGDNKKGDVYSHNDQKQNASNSNVKQVVQAQTSIMESIQFIAKKQSQKEESPPSVAKQLTDTVKQINATLILQTNLKTQEDSPVKDAVKDQNSNQQKQNQPVQPQQLQLIAISFPVAEHHTKIQSRKTLEYLQKQKPVSEEPQYFSLIQSMTPIKKVMKKRAPPVILYDSNTDQKIVGLVLNQQDNNLSKSKSQDKDNDERLAQTQNKQISQQKLQDVKRDTQKEKRSIPSHNKDFLDEVISVNKMINHQESKDYEKDNIYLNGKQQ